MNSNYLFKNNITISDEVLLWGKGDKNNQKIPKIIWIYWDPLVASPLVEICINKIKLLHRDYEVNILNKTNLKDYLPEIVPQRRDLPFANYSDIIRLELLYTYGGIWIDASTLITEKIDWILENNYQDVDVIGFYADFVTKNKSFPILETWFIATSKQNKFIKSWLYEYKECYMSDNPSAYFQEIKDNQDWVQGIDAELADYLICYLAAIKIIRTNNNYRLLMHSANASAHYYNFGLKLKPHQLCKVFLFNRAQQTPPKMIKFERRGREAIDLAIYRGQYTRKSLLFKIAPDPNYLKNKLPRFFRYVLFILSNYFSKIKKHK